jgi:ubiquinone biosynthesis protein
MKKRRIHTVLRALEISRVGAKYLVFYKLTSLRHEGLGVRLRRSCEELGLAFVKIGQILSMRYDILSREDCDALQGLLDNVNPIPIETIFAIVEHEYGRPWRDVFASFDEAPLGSASVSQVHKATLHDGSVAAVKIKRPEADKEFSSDIKILKALARIGVFFSPTLRYIQVRDLVDYFESWTRQDLDFRLEAKNMRRIKEQYQFGATNFRNDLGRGVFIAPFEDLCTENIVVMDFVDGIPMSQKEEILKRADYDIEKSIKTYVSAALRNWFRDDITTYLFQADPHLSNILALPHGDAANIDCGLIFELSMKEITITKELVIAVYMQDIERTVRIAVQMTGVNYKKYAPILRPDIEEYLSKTSGEGLGFWFIEFARIMVKNRIKFPLFLTTFGRTNVILDGLAKTYMPEQNTLDICGGELKRQAMKEMINNVTDGDWLGVAYALSEKIKKSPELVTGLIDRYFDDPLQAVRDFRDAMRV